MNGAYPLSSLYFKLYKLSPQNGSAQSDFSLAATRLHNSIGSYHCKMNNIIGQMNAEVDRLRKAVFSKENERVGALALASSTASGFVRVGENLSFSHRIFSSATFWRYWMVLDRSLLILYSAPGGTRPSFIIPLRASSELRSLSMSSSSNKTASGIAGNHVQQKGFAVFDSIEGTELFFVTTNDSDYRMWTQAISMVLKKEETTTPEIISTENDHGDNNVLSATDLVEPPAPSVAQNVDPLEVFDGAPTTSAPPQAPNLDPFGATEETTTSANQFGVFDVPPPVPTAQEEISPVDDFEPMEDVEMEEISLGDSEKISNDLPDINETVSSTDIPLDRPTPSVPPSHNQELQNSHPQSLPMRERLALAKGKSKMASSRFGSVLKTAKGGVLAASEVGRDGIKQMVKETPRKEEPRRSLAVGQKMSMLKRNASTKLIAARSSMQDQIHVRTEDLPEPTFATALPSSSSRDELSGNRKLVVGQKMSLLKKNASTKLTSLSTTVRLSVQDQPLKSVNTEDSHAPPDVPMSSSQDELSTNRSGKQELRKKLANLDQSMSNTMRRLKIDEKMTQFSAAVKKDPMMRQLSNVNLSHSRNSEHSRQRLGIGEESKSIKPIKFDARETFGSSSELPLRVKSISSGDALLIDDNLSEKMESLRKIEGSWVVAVDTIKLVDSKLLNAEIANDNVSALSPSTDHQNKPYADNQVHNKWKYRITATDALCGTDVNTQGSVERSMSEVLLFHTRISEIIAKHLPSTVDVVSQEGFRHADTSNPVFEKLSPFERLRVSGIILQRVIDVNPPSISSSSLIKVFLSTLLECHMPEEAVTATEVFLNIDNSQSEVSNDYGTYLTNGTQSVDEAFGLVSNATTLEKQPGSSQSNSLDINPKCDQPYSSLLNVIMDGYTKAMKERDEALASLATTSIINDNRIVQEQLARSNSDSKSQDMKKQGSKKNSSDEDDMLTLCKQLGAEIALRTAAESEVNRLNERLEFERKIAEVKENELKRSLAPANTATDLD